MPHSPLRIAAEFNEKLHRLTKVSYYQIIRAQEDAGATIC